jgi:hypothetical protein
MNDSNPRLRHRRAAVALFGALALATVGGCGGLAASPETSDEVPNGPVQGTPEANDPDVDNPEVSAPDVSPPEASAPDVSPPETSDEASETPEGMPAQFDVLELLQLFDASTEDDASYGCAFKARISINLPLGRLANEACRSDVTGSYVRSLTSAKAVAPEKLAEVQRAYRAVRSSNTRKCTSGASIFTLAVEVGRARDRREQLLADDDHAGCPVPGIESTGYADGLSELYAVLAPLLAD